MLHRPPRTADRQCRASHPVASARAAYTLLEVLVVIAIMGVLTGLVMPAVQRVRAASQRAECLNKLKQVGLAAHAYHDTHRSLPPGCSYRNGADPQPHMSWLTRLLPYVEHEVLWREAVQAFEREKFFERPPHLPILGRVMPLFVCPADDRSQSAWDYPSFRVAFTDYLGVEGSSLSRSDGVLYVDSSVRFADVSDGASGTLMAGERPPSVDHDLGWWYAGWGQLKTGSAEMTLGVRELRAHPRYWRCPGGPYAFEPVEVNNPCDVFQFWSFHRGGAHFLFCDGSVRFLTYPADPILPALATRSGGEPVTIPD
ncbi:MAG TPA: DUF1559 domain-containing protein [Gemmataceae bacterium]|jgi:prepilin-type N-terminal cleavage/methylation domain-containing protein/prepilin-type processing-associated H-X9-DG protein